MNKLPLNIKLQLTRLHDLGQIELEIPKSGAFTPGNVFYLQVNLLCGDTSFPAILAVTPIINTPTTADSILMRPIPATDSIPFNGAVEITNIIEL